MHRKWPWRRPHFSRRPGQNIEHKQVKSITVDVQGAMHYADAARVANVRGKAELARRFEVVAARVPSSYCRMVGRIDKSSDI